MKRVKTAFFGSSKYSLPFLNLLARHELIDLSLVISTTDKPLGRGLDLKPTPVKQWARESEILTLTPSELNNPLFLGTLTSLPLKLAIIAYYGLIIPKKVIDLFPLGMLNIHHSILPKHRGSNPIAWAILAGEKRTGTTIIRISEKYDEGEIVAFDEEEILLTDTTETLRDRLDRKAATLLEKVIPRYIEGKVNLRKQNKLEGTYEPKLTKEMGKISWGKTDEEIERMVRAFSPWPGAWTTINELSSLMEDNNSRLSETSRFWRSPISRISPRQRTRSKDKRVKILKAHLDDSQKLSIDKVQVEGKNPISFEEFRSGYLS